MHFQVISRIIVQDSECKKQTFRRVFVRSNVISDSFDQNLLHLLIKRQIFNLNIFTSFQDSYHKKLIIWVIVLGCSAVTDQLFWSCEVSAGISAASKGPLPRLCRLCQSQPPLGRVVPISAFDGLCRPLRLCHFLPLMDNVTGCSPEDVPLVSDTWPCQVSSPTDTLWSRSVASALCPNTWRSHGVMALLYSSPQACHILMPLARSHNSN